jgi:hypothetical protein
MAIMRPGASSAGTLASAVSLTVVEAQTWSVPRCGRETSVVAAPEEMVPLVAMKALPFMTCNAPVTTAALPGIRLSNETIAMGFAGTVTAGMEITGELDGACARD